jgi:hypothetical protein
MDTFSNETLVGIAGAILGSAASFAFGAVKECYDTRNARATAIRRTQFSILRQTNELRDILRNMEHARHVKDRHRFIQLIPKLGILHQIKVEELDFLVEEGHLSAQDLQELDLANAAYLNTRFVNDLRNRAFSSMQANTKPQMVNGNHVTGICNVLDDLNVADATNNLFDCIDDAIVKCDKSIKTLLKAGREWRALSDTKFYDFSSKPVAKNEWERLSNAKIDFRHISHEMSERGCCILDARLLRQLSPQITGLAISVVVDGKANACVIPQISYANAIEIAQRLGATHYYWFYKGILSLIDPSHSRPSVKCQEAA